MVQGNRVSNEEKAVEYFEKVMQFIKLLRQAAHTCECHAVGRKPAVQTYRFSVLLS